MLKRLLPILSLLTWCLTINANPTEGMDAAKAALSHADSLIAQGRQSGDAEREGLARWQKVVTLKNYSLTKEQLAETDIQMEWFSKHGQWDRYYRTWQLKANALSAMGRLQSALQETQRMLTDANERNNRLGRAMAYKQIGIIYLNMKQTQPAVEALKRYAELMKDEDDDFSSISSIYYRMAKAYDYDRAYDQELKLTDDWLRFLHTKVGKVRKADVRECYNACYLARTAALIGLGDLNEAKLALDTAFHHTNLINRTLSSHHYYKMKARYHLAEGDAAKALLYTDSVSLTTNEKDDHTDEVRAQALIMLGQGEEAARIYQRLYHDKDSVFGQEARQHLDELNTLFQVDELKKEQERTKLLYILVAASSILLALLLLLYYGWRSAIRQKKANEQLRIANERAKSSSKMKSEFIRNISHEIRTPLNIVSGFTQVLTSPDMDLPDDEKKDIQQRVTESTDRITRLVDRMLELSDASSEAVIERNDVVDAQDLMQQAVEHSRIALFTRPDNPTSAVVFENPYDEAAASVTLRTNKLYAVRTIAHLLENAVKFTHEGSITLRTEVTDQVVRYIVEDTGIGIPADQVEHIYDEFVKLDAFSDGTGIGLTVARSIARKMGGDLWLDTDYSQGTRFVLELLR